MRAGHPQHFTEEVDQEQAGLDIDRLWFPVHQDVYPPLFHAASLTSPMLSSERIESEFQSR
jgi:hypothetical protein